MRLRWILFAGLIVIISCSKNKNGQEAKTPERIVDVPESIADSTYFFVKKQLDFGPRVPNSKAHLQAGDYFIKTFKRFGAVVTVQNFEGQSYDGKKLDLRNIIASFFPEKQKRILLAAHWDTRPFADKDRIKPYAPFDGANDGASGAAVLLEIARVLHSSATPEVGVDIILFDGEDWGEPDTIQGTTPLPPGQQEWWCLGSQYWATHKHKPNYAAYYGILVDMVGAQGAKFYREGFSLEYAPSIVERVWSRAAKLGYSSVFIPQNVPPITDDHRFVNELAKIPMIDIVQYDPAAGFFGDYHHTQKDNLELISPQTLQIVTDVVLNVIYYEQ